MSMQKHIILFAILFFLCPAACNATEPSFAERLERCEIAIFGRAFPGMSIPKRINKIEVNLWGRTIDSSVPDALDAMEEAIFKTATIRQNQQPPPAKPPKFEDDEQEDENPVETLPASRRPQGQSEIETILDEAVWHFEHGHLVTAKEKLAKILSIDPNHPDANFNAGVIAESEGQLEVAEKHYARAHAFSPKDEDYTTSLRKIQEKIATTRPISPIAQRRTHSDWVEDEVPTREKHNTSSVSTELPESYRNSEADKRSSPVTTSAYAPEEESNYHPPTTMEPQVDSKAAYNKAMRAFKSGDFDLAADHLTDFVETCPTDHKAQFALGLVLKQAGDRRSALRHMRKAAALAPENQRYQDALAEFDDAPCPLPTQRPAARYGLPKQKPGGVTAMEPEPGEIAYNMANSSIGKLIRYGLAGAAIGAGYGMNGGGMGRSMLSGGLFGIGIGLIRGF